MQIKRDNNDGEILNSSSTTVLNLLGKAVDAVNQYS